MRIPYGLLALVLVLVVGALCAVNFWYWPE